MKTVPLPPGLFIFAILLSIIANHFLPLLKLIPRPYSYFGTLLMILGLFVMGWQGRTMRAHQTTIEFRKAPSTSTLITDGPFGFSRNPGYIGQLVLVSGVAVLLGSLSPFFILLINFLLLDRLVVPIEEETLEQNFGSQYRDYKNKVRRWI